MTTVGPAARLDPRALAEASPNRLGPWTPDHLIALVVANVLGLAAVLVGWWVARDQADAGNQVAWVNLAVLGFLVAGGANGVWLARGRQSVRRAQRATLARFSTTPQQAPRTVPLSTNGNGRGATVHGWDELVATPEMTRYHRPTCVLAAGKATTAADRVAHERAGRRACEVCAP